jgi:hypothetical protein
VLVLSGGATATVTTALAVDQTGITLHSDITGTSHITGGAGSVTRSGVFTPGANNTLFIKVVDGTDITVYRIALTVRQTPARPANN